MGFKKSWDVVQIIGQLRSMGSECSSPYNDGFISRDIKQDLVQIKFLLDDIIERCPTFVGEEEWHHQRMVDKLK